MRHLLITAAFGAAAAAASAQGLLSVIPTQAETASRPWGLAVTANAGWDSNINTSSTDEMDSIYAGGTVDAGWAYVTDRTVASIDASLGMNYYFDQIDGRDSDRYNLRFGTGITHALTDRLSLDWDLYVGYQFDPDFARGATATRNLSQYWYGDMSLGINYLLTERLTSSTRLSLYGIEYEDDGTAIAGFAGNRENRVNYGISQLFRYEATETLGLRAEYRYRYTDYDSGLEAHNHDALVGADYAIDEQTMLLMMLGATFYDSDLEDSSVRPYLELGITRGITDVLSLRWANRLGYEDTGIGRFSSNYTFRSNLDLNYQVSERVGSYAGLSYIYSDYDGTTRSGDTQHLFEGRLGLNYALTQMISLGLNYSYTNRTSDFAISEYDRHRVNLGVTASF